MNRIVQAQTRILAASVLVTAILLSGSCRYFDPLNPLQRSANPQTPSEVTWEKDMGGPGEDGGMSVKQTTDGGYIIAGYIGQNVWLIKTDASGEEEWDKSFGGAGEDRGSCVQQTADGGYVIVGTTASYGAGDMDVWLIKTDTNGDELWIMPYGGTLAEQGMSVQQTGDGGYIIAGTTETYVNAGDSTYDAWLVKTDSTGNVEWDNHYDSGSLLADWVYCVRQTSDGGYIFCGFTGTSAGYTNVYLVKTDAYGTEEWSKEFGEVDALDRGRSVLQTADGGYLVVGGTQSYAVGEWDVWIIKTDENGVTEWTHTIGEIKWDEGHSVEPTADGGYIIGGTTKSDMVWAQWEDMLLIKIDAYGQEQWIKGFGGGYADYGQSVWPTDDGGYVLVGESNSFPGGMEVYLVYYKP
jgi:hypothetical protein